MLLLLFSGNVSGINGTVAESFSLTDAQTVQVDYAVTQAETVAFTDTQTATAVFNATQAESVAFTDSQTATAVFSATEAESIAFTDSQTANAVFAVTEAESIAFSDGQDASIVSGGVSQTNETIAFTDAQTAQAVFNASVSESIGFADAQDATGGTVISQGGGVPHWNPYRPTGETEEQKRARREAQGIIQRAKQPKADIQELFKEAATVSAFLKSDIERLEKQAAEYQALIDQRRTKARAEALAIARNDALATRQLQAQLIEIQLIAERQAQQIEELDVVFMAVMLAAL